MNFRILIVEDERIIAMDLQLQLQALGYAVCAVVASGPQAIDKALELRPDLVLMDIHLEGAMDGVEAAREIHQRLRIPIIFLSAYAEDATLQRAESALPYGYLVKPVSPRELHATLQMAMVRFGIQRGSDEQVERFCKAMEAAQLEVWEWHVEIDQMNVFSLNGNDMRSLSSVLCESIRSFLQHIDPRDESEVASAINRTRQGGDSFNVSFRLRADDQADVRWMEAHGKRFDDGERGGRIIGVMQDVTERRRAEERLRQAVTVFESTAEGIAILDAGRKVISANPAFSQLTGYAEDEAKAWPSIDALYQVPHSAPFLEQLRHGERQMWQGNASYLHRNGAALCIWESISIVPGLDGAIGNYVLVFSDISSVLAVQEQLDFLAKHDPLTSLCNRRMLHDRLEYELAQAARHGSMVAVLLLDLDHFKTINDSLGHGVGDQVLALVARRLQSCMRASDTVARLGGDEFCIVFGGIGTLGDVDQVAQKALARLAEPIELEHMTCYVTGSIGIALSPADGASVDELLRNADQAMYGAKHAGRNRCCFYAPAMQKAAEVRLRISSGLHEALERKQLLLAYQPIVELGTGRVHKAEALLRWRHPQQGNIAPAAFIPIAEECGMIGELSEWVLDEALRAARIWRETLRPDFRISINVSALHFREKQNHQHWLRKLADSGVPGDALVLEITEGVLLGADYAVQEALERYHAAGIRIALDDFGTGYSALSYLKRYRLDYLKIDQSFVRQIAEDARDLALCEAIIMMARKLGLEVIAEGVETEAQAAILRANRCQYAQGFLYSQALPADEFSAWLQRSDGIAVP
ncbi:EAL domain-containing protein [Chromobacterium subtsugae]|uniref:EAL domain-containing protein n=2 Tax=Chromobacterium subtsugae TaxID=251747 RepID=A0ABS7FAJ6_9NEIS|nr:MULTISPECIES: EAL domain-containing protein [Chromobacterium]KUM02363.1 hypothetical protein Cv017_03575 [Chromobacterium subtsugae]KZE87210.1 hypothetical protein AWB61_12775 [Chromobacterium sp. F49]MBW7565837.1 EAL domain-containing protein [Chromobacterium subtsugae]MBW8287123.1 EAL domain-containing protein [Chromobacterium subtsugae]WSE93199.1 EAL domain-containing protein [Chromobacterium subtsugae]